MWYNGYKEKGGEEMQMGFFSEENRMEKLSKLGDSLVRLNEVINWEQFRPILKKTTAKEHKGLGGSAHPTMLF